MFLAIEENIVYLCLIEKGNNTLLKTFHKMSSIFENKNIMSSFINVYGLLQRLNIIFKSWLLFKDTGFVYMNTVGK